MRFVYLIFFLLLGIHSQFVFSQEPPPDPVCSSRSVQSACTDMQNISGSTLSYFNSLCYSQPGRHQAIEPPTTSCQGGRMSIVCYSQCSCPDGFNFKTSLNPITGVKSSGCFPSGEGDGDGGQTPEDPPSCDEGEKVYDPITGTMVCPGSGDGSGSSSSNSSFCLVPGDFDGDCIPDDQNSSDPSASSSPDTGSSGGSSGNSSAGGGDDGDGDGGNDGGGNGGDGDGGSNNGGSGSASSAHSDPSWNPHSGYGNWIPVPADSNCPNKYQDSSGQWWCAGNGLPAASAGSAMSVGANECDYTSKTYFSCINQKSLDGNDTGFNHQQSYGNWLPVSADSPCVNKFQDASGNWWCAPPSGGGGAGGAASASSAGSSGSSGSEGSSNSEGSASSSSSNSSSSFSCSASSVPSGSSASDPCSGGTGSASSSGSLSSLGEKGEFDGEESEKTLEEIQEDLASKIDDIKDEIQSEFASTIRGTGSIEDFCKDIRGKEVCFGMKKFEDWLDPISQAIFLVACVLSFAIVLGGRS